MALDTYTILVAFLAFASVLCIGGALILAATSGRGRLQARLHGTSDLAPAFGTMESAEPLHVVGRLGKAVGGKTPSRSLQAQMLKAGFYSRSAVPVFLGVKLLLFASVFMLLGMLALLLPVSPLIKGVIALCGAGLSFFFPNIYLDIRCSGRTAEVRRHLPDMVDLLEICVSGGMGLDMAWNAVSDEIRSVSPLLADEMALTNLELHLGEDRGMALRHMAERTGADELGSLVAVLVQSQKFGTSVADALKSFAESMRELRSLRAEEAAEKMPVKMLIPMTCFIFPVVFIVAAGPAAIKIYDVMSRT